MYFNLINNLIIHPSRLFRMEELVWTVLTSILVNARMNSAVAIARSFPVWQCFIQRHHHVKIMTVFMASVSCPLTVQTTLVSVPQATRGKDVKSCQASVLRVMDLGLSLSLSAQNRKRTLRLCCQRWSKMVSLCTTAKVSTLLWNCFWVE